MIFVEKRGKRFLVDDAACNHWWTTQFPIWEPETFDIFDKHLTKDMTYIDVGAWIGPTVLYASKIAKVCYAIEPDPVAFAQLKMNTLGMGNIMPLKHAIYNQDRKIILGCDDPLGNSTTRIGSNEKLFEVPAVTLDTFVQTWGITTPMFIKMDIEGAEEYILQDVGFFEKYRPILYVSLHRKWWNHWTGSEESKSLSQIVDMMYSVYQGNMEMDLEYNWMLLGGTRG